MPMAKAILIFCWQVCSSYGVQPAHTSGDTAKHDNMRANGMVPNHPGTQQRALAPQKIVLIRIGSVESCIYLLSSPGLLRAGLSLAGFAKAIRAKLS